MRNTIVNKTVREETKRQEARERKQKVHCKLTFNEVFLVKRKVFLRYDYYTTYYFE